MITRFFTILVCLLSVSTMYAQHSLTKIWETDTSLKVPESVRYDDKRNQLYVANIEGEPWKKDEVGSIALLNLDGTIKKLNWIKGLNAPKGMDLHRNKLYVADVDRVVVINIRKGKIKKIIPIAGATHLNDVVIGKRGTVYVSESRNRAVYTIEKDEYIKKILDSNQLKRPNGLHIVNGLLHILDNGKLLQVQKDKTLKTLAEGMEGGTDGLELINETDFIISCWEGAIWYINAKLEKQLLLDSRAAKQSTADIGINKEKRIIYVPGFFTNKVTAYQVL